jgi:hypothetical protein
MIFWGTWPDAYKAGWLQGWRRMMVNGSHQWSTILTSLEVEAKDDWQQTIKESGYT